MQSPRHLQFILVLAHQGLGSQQGHHIYTNDNGDGHGFALSFRLGQKSPCVSGGDRNTHFVTALELTAVDRHILLASFGIGADQESRSDVGPAIVFVVNRCRKKSRQINRSLMNHLLNFGIGFGYHLARQG